MGIKSYSLVFLLTDHVFLLTDHVFLVAPFLYFFSPFFFCTGSSDLYFSTSGFDSVPGFAVKGSHNVLKNVEACFFFGNQTFFILMVSYLISAAVVLLIMEYKIDH